MPGPNPHEIRVAGTGRVLVAALGTAVPADTRAPWTPGWKDLGHTCPDGITFAKKDKLHRVDTWRSVSSSCFVYSGRDLSLKLALAQLDEAVLPLLFGGDGGQAIASKTEARMLAVEFADGDAVKYRFVVPRGRVTESGEPAPTRTAAARLDATFTALAGDDAAALASLLMADPSYATV